MKDRESLSSKKSFRELISKVFKRKPSKPKPVRVERDTTHLRKKWAKQAAGRKYRRKCLRRHQEKMTARRRAKNKSAARSRRINRKRGCRPHSAGRK